MRNKVAIICCYYGILPEIFPYWLDSCKANQDFTFFLVSDIDGINLAGATNVFQLRYSMQEIKEKAEVIVNFTVSLEKPYRLCDFKPMYGQLFSDELKGYDFWGHCDMDMVFGDLSSFIGDDKLDKYEKIYEYGHLSLYRNSEKMNTLYQIGGGRFSYKEVFSRPEFFSFDEYRGMPQICKSKGIPVYSKEECADITLSRSRLYMNRQENADHQVFVRMNGKILRLFWDEANKDVRCDEYVYIHFKNRRFAFKASANMDYIITPDAFLPLQQGVSIGKKEIMALDGFIVGRDRIDRFRYLTLKMKDLFKMSLGQKYVYLKQRL